MLTSTDCTHAEESKGGTEDGTKQGCFGVDVLWRSNELNNLANDTTIVDNVRLPSLKSKKNKKKEIRQHRVLTLLRLGR